MTESGKGYVEKTAETITSTASYIAETVKPYAGETAAGYVKTIGDYEAAGVTKAGELLGLKGKDPIDTASDKTKQTVNAASDATMGASEDTKAETGSTMGSIQAKADELIGKPANKSYTDHASEALSKGANTVKAETDKAYENPQKYAEDTYNAAVTQVKSALGQDTSTTGLDTAKDTAGSVTDSAKGTANQVGKEADAFSTDPVGYGQSTKGSAASSLGSAAESADKKLGSDGTTASKQVSSTLGDSADTAKGTTGSALESGKETAASATDDLTSEPSGKKTGLVTKLKDKLHIGKDKA